MQLSMESVNLFFFSIVMVRVFGSFDSFFVVLGLFLYGVYEVGSLFERLFEVIRSRLVEKVDFGQVVFESGFGWDDVLDEQRVCVFYVKVYEVYYSDIYKLVMEGGVNLLGVVGVNCSGDKFVFFGRVYGSGFDVFEGCYVYRVRLVDVLIGFL